MTCISFDSNNAEIGDTKLVGDITYEYKGNNNMKKTGIVIHCTDTPHTMSVIT